jgi:hypothetical protein
VRPLLAVAVAAILFSACNRRQPDTGAIHIDPALEALVPSDTLFIMGANIDAIRNTSVYQKHIGVVNLPRLNEFSRQTGIDLRKDLSQVLSVSNGKTGVLLARGKFAEGDLQPRLEKQGAKRFGYKGHDLFGDDRNGVMFLNSTTALAGSTATLKSIIDDGNQPHSLPPAIAEMIRSIPGDNQIWAAFIGGTQGLNMTVPENSNLANAIRVFKGMDRAALGMDLRNGIDLNGNAICNTEDNAKQLRAALKGIIGLGRLSTPDSRPELLKLYDAIQVDQAQQKVTVTAHIPPDLVNKFIDLWVTVR